MDKPLRIVFTKCLLRIGNEVNLPIQTFALNGPNPKPKSLIPFLLLRLRLWDLFFAIFTTSKVYLQDAILLISRDTVSFRLVVYRRGCK